MRDYAIGLSEEDLRTAIIESRADFVLLSGDDAGFSAVSYLAYFENSPAFSLLHSTSTDRTASYLFAVDRDALDLPDGPLFLDPRDLAYIDASVRDGSAGDAALWQRLAPRGIVLNGGALIDAKTAAALVRDQRAAGSPGH